MSKSLRSNQTLLSKRTFVLGVAFLVVGIVILGISRAETPDSAVNIYEPIKAAKGQEAKFKGLRKVKKDVKHPCAGVFEVENKKDLSGNSLCTTANDSEVINQSKTEVATKLRSKITKETPKTTEDTVKELKATGKPPLNSSVINLALNSGIAQADVDQSGVTPFIGTKPTCFGTGKDGRRIVLVAAGTKEQPITTSDLENIKQVAAEMESTLIWNSYRQNPNNVKHIRFFQNADCQPDIITATQSSDYFNELSVATYGSLHKDAGIAAAVNLVKQKATGQNLIPHFLVFSRSGAHGCGQRDFALNGGLDNQQAFSYMYGKTQYDKSLGDACWNSSVAMHETMHALGAVDFTSPHSTLFSHCYDEEDMMCYDDNGGVTPMKNICPLTETYLKNFVMDCNADDYFSVKADADKVFNPLPWWQGGSGAAHYNTAKSGFLSAGNAAPPQPEVPPTVSIVSPVTGAVVSPGGNLNISASAASSSGIAKVVFYNGSSIVSEDNTAPYAATLTAVKGPTVSLKAVVYDSKNVQASSNIVTITVNTTSTSDTIAPVGPDKINYNLNFDLTRGGYGISLSWPAATDNTGVTKYSVSRNNIEIGTTTATKYYDAKIAPNTRYNYIVKAVDAAGNQSAGSAPAITKVTCLLFICGLTK